MTAPAETAPVAAKATRRRRRRPVLAGIRDSLFAVNVVIGTIWIASLVLSSVHGQIVASAWMAMLAVSAVMIAVIGGIAHDLYYWRWPIRNARNVLAELSKGAAPLDDLRSLRRGMRCLMPAIMDLAHRERALRAQIARLEIEVKQRVVTRTESLERKLGALQLQASKDVLTGLFNRRAFDLELPKVVEACRKSKRDLHLLMIDVDHFKTLNDTFGHPAGDELLRSIGQVMRSTIRERDMAFRYGGDEFVLLVPGDLEAAETLAERLKSLVDGLTKHHQRALIRPAETVDRHLVAGKNRRRCPSREIARSGRQKALRRQTRPAEERATRRVTSRNCLTGRPNPAAIRIFQQVDR